ncbi:MAG: ParB/RepB/Spo0J family partition protein, partial [Gammaproteobacteria bacterium]|nr:ParB/RepB/Spo0J family partition protein [Gammaproteobacteria bacterium]
VIEVGHTAVEAGYVLGRAARSSEADALRDVSEKAPDRAAERTRSVVTGEGVRTLAKLAGHRRLDVFFPVMTAPVLMENTPRVSTLGDGALAHLPLDCIAVQNGFNPRRFFEETGFAARVDSVRCQGVLQAVWVRPQADFNPRAPRFWLIAGERRWRAARTAGLTTFPALIRHIDKRQALVLADLENNPVLRIGLSVAEEARFAQRFVADAVHPSGMDRRTAALIAEPLMCVLGEEARHGLQSGR